MGILDKIFEDLKKKAIKRSLKNEPQYAKKWEKDQEKINNEKEIN